MTRQTVERWEKGVHRPQPGTVALVLGVIAAKLRVDAAALGRWITTGEVPEEPPRPVSRKPKDIDTEQQVEEWLDSLGEGARREFED